MRYPLHNASSSSLLNIMSKKCLNFCTSDWSIRPQNLITMSDRCMWMLLANFGGETFSLCGQIPACMEPFYRYSVCSCLSLSSVYSISMFWKTYCISVLLQHPKKVSEPWRMGRNCKRGFWKSSSINILEICDYFAILSNQDCMEKSVLLLIIFNTEEYVNSRRDSE